MNNPPGDNPINDVAVVAIVAIVVTATLLWAAGVALAGYIIETL